MSARFLFTAIFSVLIVSVVSAQDPKPQTKPYLLGPGDEITVRVLGEPDFDFVANVNEDGFIEGPFFSKPIMAKCRSDRELTADVITELKRQLKSPQVNLRITAQKSRPPATIYGEVHIPSQIELHRKASLVELLALAGGPTEDANGVVQVIRTQTPICTADVDEKGWIQNDVIGSPTQSFSLAMVKQGDPKANPTIYPGDVVIVQRALPVYITGEVMQPQGVYLKEGGMTLSEAIAKIGGVRLEAKTKDIKVYRLKPDSKEREVIAANYDLIRAGKQKDISLEPYDIIQVDKAKDSMAKMILDFAAGTGKTFVSSGVTNIGYHVLY